MGSDTETELLESSDSLGEPGALSLLVGHRHGFTAHRIVTEVVRIGRGDENDLVLADKSVSREHVLLRTVPSLAVEDLGSANGSRLRGRALEPGRPVPLEIGDVLEIGGVTVLVQGSRADIDERAAAAERSPMERVDALIERVAPRSLSVLLLGETGVGKEVCAARLHALSRRSERPFLKLNCAALSENLLESELFGHERGAFTGAVATKPGLIESANGGTVFLDEVGDLPAALQAKLLRVLEAREVMRVGGLEPRMVDVRFVAATNRPLERDVAEGRFRRDLYFRLAGVIVDVPPLRDRIGEIPRLAEQFAATAAEETGAPPPVLSAAALEALRAHRWPGNIRELRNVIERAAALCDGDAIGPEHLELRRGALTLGAEAEADVPAAAPEPPPVAAATPADRPLRDEIAEVEKQQILDALQKCGGNQTRAARLLGIARGTLRARMDAYGIPRPRS